MHVIHRYPQHLDQVASVHNITRTKQSIPAPTIILLALGTFQGISTNSAHYCSLEHECNSTIKLGGGVTYFLHILIIALGIGTMRGHYRMNTCSTGDEPSSGGITAPLPFLGIVLSIYQTHEFGHDITMKPWWSKGILV